MELSVPLLHCLCILVRLVSINGLCICTSCVYLASQPGAPLIGRLGMASSTLATQTNDVACHIPINSTFSCVCSKILLWCLLSTMTAYNHTRIPLWGTHTSATNQYLFTSFITQGACGVGMLHYKGKVMYLMMEREGINKNDVRIVDPLYVHCITLVHHHTIHSQHRIMPSPHQP